MRKKVKRILALLLAIGLAVSVTSGIALSTSAETDAAQVSQEEPVESEPAAASEEPAAEPAQEEQEGSEEADPEPAAEEEKQGEAEEAASTGEALDQTVTVGSGDKTVKVRTTAEAGVLPEGATLVVKQLEKDDSQYEDAADQLEANEITYDGMLALDVGFEVNGQKVEPTGSVDVKFELGAGLLPEDADTDSLAVQHLPDSSKVETVADAGNATEGTVTVQDQKVNADFTVNSFSTFTITWAGWDTYFKVTVHYVDESGADIDTATSGAEISSGESYTFTGKSIDNYTYQGAHYGSYNGDIVEKVVASQAGNFLSTTRYLTFYNEADQEVAKLTRGPGDNTQTADVYLVYKAESSGGGSGGTGGEIVTEQNLTHEKYVEDNGNGTYDLSLTVSGAKGTVTNPVLLDILFIVDTSSSMEGTGISNVKSAMQTFKNSLVTKENNGTVSVQTSVVTFGTEASLAQTWQSGVTAAYNTINGISIKSDQGTNYEAGIEMGKRQLNQARAGAQTVVIFLTDGEPTFCLDNKGEADQKWGDSTCQATINEGENAIKGMKVTSFYAIGAGLKNEIDIYDDNYGFWKVGTTTGAAILDGLVNNVTASTKKRYLASSSDLKDIFDKIAADITTLLCTNVTVTDPLSENVDVVAGADGQPTKLTVTVKNKTGAVVASGETSVTIDGTTITATYAPATKTIVMDFADNYQLNPEYTYIVTTTIQATEKAYENYRNNNNAYPDTGEAGTGATSAGKLGLYSNQDGQAKVTYTYNGANESEEYPMPVIQIEPGTLVIEKTITGLTATEIATLQNMSFTYTLSNGTPQTVTLGDFTPANGANGKYIYTVSRGLSPGTTYTVTENTNSAQVAGYDLTSSHVNPSGTITKGTTTTASFTNAYVLSNRTITLKKVVAGNMGDTNKEFTFGVGDNASIADTTLKHNEQTTITARVGQQVTITETDYSSDGYDTTASGITGGTYADHAYTFTVTADMSEATVITFTNTKNVEVPNGLTHNITPYIIMVVLAAGAGVYFVVRRRPRGRHCK